MFYFSFSVQFSDVDSMYDRNLETGDFLCLTCGYTNKHKQNLQKHVETHLDMPRSECKYCFKTFKTANSLQVHISTNHKKN